MQWRDQRVPRGQGAKTTNALSMPRVPAASCTLPFTLNTLQHLNMASRQRSEQQAAAPSILSLPQDALVNILGRLSLAERCAKGVDGGPRHRRPQQWPAALTAARHRLTAGPLAHTNSSPSLHTPCPHAQAQCRRLCLQELPGCGGGPRAAAHRGP